MMLPPCIPIALSVVAGILLAQAQVLPLLRVIAFGAACLIAGIAFRRRPRPAFAALLGVWICAGLLRAAHWSHQPPQPLARFVSVEPSPVALHGVIVDDPVELFGPGEPEQQVGVLRAQHARMDRRWQPVDGLVRVNFQAPRALVSYGDEVILDGRWSSIPSPGNPGQYDWRAALARQKIFAAATVGPSEGVAVLRHGQGAWWRAGIGRLKTKIEQLLDRTFAPQQAGLLRSLLLGERVALSDELKRAFMETGTIHLLVISGFNVGLIAAMLELFLRLLSLPLRPRLLLSAAALFGYWVLTGMQPPVTRATLMAWAVLGALSLDRIVNWPNVLAAAALVILAAQPSQLFEPSFQLSFGAVISLLALTAPLRRLLEPRLTRGPDWLRRYAGLSVASTAAIWIGLWPMLAWYFHLMAPVSIAANLVLAPLVSLTVGCGTALAFLGLAAPAILVFSRGALGALLTLSMACVTWLHRLPGGAWPMGHPAWPVIAGYYGLLCLSLARRRLRLSLPAVAVCWLAAVNAGLWGAVAANRNQAAWLQVTVLDVGHGDAIAIRTPGGQRLLVDAGTREAGQRVVVPFLRHEGWTALDGLVLTHADEDHLGGAGAVMDAVPVRRLFTNGFAPDTDVARRTLATAARRRILGPPLVSGQRLTGDRRVELLVMNPPAAGVPGAPLADNENSVVLRVAYGDVSMLLCADIDEDGLPWLAQWGSRLRSTVVKVPHHGSRLGAWGRELLARISPRVAVISVGRLHRLPSAETLRNLSDAGAATLTTRDAGAVTLLTDGRRLLVRPFRPAAAPRV